MMINELTKKIDDLEYKLLELGTCRQLLWDIKHVYYMIYEDILEFQQHYYSHLINLEKQYE